MISWQKYREAQEAKRGRRQQDRKRPQRITLAYAEQQRRDWLAWLNMADQEYKELCHQIETAKPEPKPQKPRKPRRRT